MKKFFYSSGFVLLFCASLVPSCFFYRNSQMQRLCFVNSFKTCFLCWKFLICTFQRWLSLGLLFQSPPLIASFYLINSFSGQPLFQRLFAALWVMHCPGINFYAFGSAGGQSFSETPSRPARWIRHEQFTSLLPIDSIRTDN